MAGIGGVSSFCAYSASKGAFIGASLNGAELNQDHKLTKELYGSDVIVPMRRKKTS